MLAVSPGLIVHRNAVLNRERTRFVLTRAWFALSVSGGGHGLQGTVVDTQPMSSGDVWRVTVRARGTTDEVFYVLGATGEVVGHALSSSPVTHECQDAGAGATMRADWAAFVEQTETEGAAVLERLQWADRGEYERGVSTLWLTRTEREGEEGKAKRTVAERYVLASVVANRCVRALDIFSKRG